MSKRELEDLFNKPMKIPRVEISKRITPQKLSSSDKENVNFDNFLLSPSSSSSPSIDETGMSLDDRVNTYFNNILKEERMVLEENYELSPSMLVGTGISIMRDLYPVVKIAPSMKHIFTSEDSTISFIPYDWHLFVMHLRGSIMNYFEMQEENVSEIMFSDYVISFDMFLGEKSVKLRHRLSNIYLNKSSASRLCDLAELISVRLSLLDNLSLSQKYFEVLRKANQILNHHHFEKADESSREALDLVKILASLCDPTINFCICEVLFLDKTRVLKDLYFDNQLYG